MRRIFISHSSKDNQVAESLKVHLKANGYRSLFLDFDPEDGIPAGRDWEQELYRRVRSCQIMIVICSRESMSSRWCFMEITHARALGKPLLALRIDDCNLDGVLADRQVVDLVSDGEKAFERLLAGILAVGLDPAKTFTLDPNRPPYPGLMAFQEEDAAVFFGRGDEITQGLELLNRVHHLGDPSVVMVLGSSGTGKSSLVRAGLVPRLRRSPERWIVVDPFRPRTDPMRELAAALSRAGAADSADVILHRSDPDVLTDALAMFQQRTGKAGSKVLLTIDQFEELLTSAEAPPFLTYLRNAVNNSNGLVVILGTMRSDFLDRFQNSVPLLGLRYEVLSVGPMTKSDITEVITEPAKEKDVELQPELVEALVEDAGTLNALPLLAFALRELWESYSDDGLLTLEEYRDKLGGVQKVVGRAAGNVQRSIRITPEQERLLRNAFLAMLRITDDSKYARRTVKWKDLPEPVRPLLERFVEARLLVSGTEGSERTLEVAHERLFESWEQLHLWISENVEALRLRREIETAASAWENKKHQDLLWRGARVDRVRELLTDGRLLLEASGLRFIEASERAKKVRRRSIIAAVSAFVIMAAVLTAIALIYAQRADYNARRAKREEINAVERAKVAEIERIKALAAKNVAELARVNARVGTIGISPDEKKALEAIVPKYREQAREYQERADSLQKELENWKKENDLQTSTAVAASGELFTLEVFRAGQGTAFLIHYGEPGDLRRVLVDGGSSRVYRDVLKPRFDALRGDKKALPFSLVISTQIDDDHMGGLIRLIEDLQPADNRFVTIDGLWSNAFIPPAHRTTPDLKQFPPKARLVTGANILGIAINTPFKSMVAAPEAGSARLNLDEHLTITVLSPRIQVLKNFMKQWVRSLQQHMFRTHFAAPELLTALNNYEIIETFENPKIELDPSPTEISNPKSEAGKDRSAVNLGSLVMMLEVKGKRILITSDVSSDIILDALAQAGYTDSNGSMDIDVLVIPHGGSDRNISADFFQRVKASHYVISANGKHGNPELSTVVKLFQARRGDMRPFSIGLTYAPEEYKSGSLSEEGEYTNAYPVAELCALLTGERSAGTPFEIVTPEKDRSSFGIDLWSPADFVNKGVKNGVCGL